MLNQFAQCQLLCAYEGLNVCVWVAAPHPCICLHVYMVYSTPLIPSFLSPCLPLPTPSPDIVPSLRPLPKYPEIIPKGARQEHDLAGLCLTCMHPEQPPL